MFLTFSALIFLVFREQKLIMDNTKMKYVNFSNMLDDLNEREWIYLK